MTTTTDTTTTPVNPERGDLTLVTLSESYARSWEGPRVLRDRDSSDDERTFYATRDRDDHHAYVTLIVPESDPRSVDMWATTGEDYGLELEGPHKGWSVLKSNVTAVSTTTTTAETRPFVAGDRVRISADHPAGEPWAGATGTVQREGYNISVRLDSGQARAAFRDEYLTHVDDDTTAEDTTAETFTREDVERLVREAREQADREAREALEAFKREANARAVEYAEQNGLCSEFERCMEDIGLMGRDDWHEANDDTYRVEFIVSVEVTARDEDDAEYKARAELYEDLSYPMDQTIQHHDTEVL